MHYNPSNTTGNLYNESKLVHLLQQRNEKAFSYLYDNYAPAIYAIIKTIINNKIVADDVLQESFIKIWRLIDMYDANKGRLFTWMVKVTRNTSIDKLRSREYRNEIVNESFTPHKHEDSISHIQFIVEHIGIKKLLSTLRKEYKILIELFYFQGYSQVEIAQMMSIPLGTVKTRMRAAVIQLRDETETI